MTGEITVFSGSAHHAFAEEMCAILGVDLFQTRTTRFSNDCLQVQLLANCRQRDVYIVQPLVPPVQENLMELLLMLDAARGMGMGRWRILWQVELPLAWPVILAGIRVSAQLTVGVVTIAAFVYPTGLGVLAFDALNNLGAVNKFNQAMASVIFVVAIALLFDAAFVLVRRFTTPRGLRV